VVALDDLLASKKIDMNLICCITTDSPSTMVKVRRDFTEKHKHIMQLGCCLHAFNLIVKDIVSKVPALDICKKNQALVNYFSKDGFWSETLSDWRKESNIEHSLSSFCETRWYSVYQVSASVKSHEKGFEHRLQLCNNALTDTPDIPNDKKDLINDKYHFLRNSEMLTVIKPVIDAIARLEKKETSICDIWKEIINVYKEISLISFLEQQNIGAAIKAKAIAVINNRAIGFNTPLYILGFFFHPAYRKIAISKRFNMDKMLQYALTFLKQIRRFNDKALAKAVIDEM